MKYVNLMKYLMTGNFFAVFVTVREAQTLREQHKHVYISIIPL